MVRSVRWTVEQLKSVPEDGKLREIIDGELWVSTQPHTYHQRVGQNVGSALDDWNDRGDSGLVVLSPGVIFTSEDAVAPDVTWTSHQRLVGALDSSGHLRRAPELVIEILSPGAENDRRDRQAKLQLYARFGVSEYWIIDWRLRLVQVFRRVGAQLEFIGTFREGDTIESPYLPGFRGDVGRFLPTCRWEEINEPEQ